MKPDIAKIATIISIVAGIATVTFLYFQYKREEKRLAIEADLNKKQIALINKQLGISI